MFVHYRQIKGRAYLIEGERVQFEAEPSPKREGTLRACKVKVLEECA